MSDVTCRVINSHRECMNEVGLSFDALVDELRRTYPDDRFFDPAILLNKRGRIPWNSFVKLEELFGKIMDGSGRPN